LRCPRAVALALVALIALAGCQSSPGLVESAPPGGGTPAQAHNRLIEAFNTCNEAAFVGAYAPQFSFATSNTRQPLTTREGLQRYLAVGCTARPNPTAALAQQITHASGPVTVLAGQYRFKVPTPSSPAAPAGGGVPTPPSTTLVEVTQNFTIVFERVGERWRVLAHHVSVAP
jgi:hypothetical protein